MATRRSTTLHSVLVFVSIKYLTISTVPPEEPFLFGRIEPHELGIFRCVLRYGYKDSRSECEFFKEMLVNQLKEFIRNDLLKPNELADNNEVEKVDEEMVQREVGIVDDALKFGDVYLMGENEMMASKGSSFLKKFAINYAYNWLKRCVRQVYEVFMIPRNRLLKVGMTYEV
ncbi:potassium transporter 5-like [Castanea sativa]|uniref:potassium transporter 5-like n=1 Tax=Castanea sativa TaxID=21020 RepID=UPI003F64CEF6